MDTFGKLPIPKTEYQNNLKEMYRSPIDRWLEDFTREHINERVVEKLGRDTYADFEKWRMNNNVNFKTDSLKLGIALSNLKIKGGIEKGRETYKGRTKYFRIGVLKTYFKIGLLIDLNEELEESKTNSDNTNNEIDDDDDDDDDNIEDDDDIEDDNKSVEFNKF